jgi:hypothetical protein
MEGVIPIPIKKVNLMIAVLRKKLHWGMSMKYTLQLIFTIKNYTAIVKGQEIEAVSL